MLCEFKQYQICDRTTQYEKNIAIVLFEEYLLNVLPKIVRNKLQAILGLQTLVNLIGWVGNYVVAEIS